MLQRPVFHCYVQTQPRKIHYSEKEDTKMKRIALITLILFLAAALFVGHSSVAAKDNKVLL